MKEEAVIFRKRWVSNIALSCVLGMQLAGCTQSSPKKVVTDVEFMGATHVRTKEDFKKLVDRQDKMLEEASKGNPLLMNNFHKMTMDNRYQCAKMLNESQFLEGMPADQLIESFGMPNIVRLAENGSSDSKSFANVDELEEWLMEESVVAADLVYNCGIQQPAPRLIIRMKHGKATNTNLENF